MKTRLNILCIFIFVAIIGSAISYFYVESFDFFSGMHSGMQIAEDKFENENIWETVFIKMTPDKIANYPDTVYNKITGNNIPIQFREITVKFDGELRSGWNNFLAGLMVLIISLSTIVQVTFFLRLIYKINKQVIFDWSNVIKLRVIGIGMVIAFCAFALFNYLHIANIDDYFSIEGYKLIISDIWNFYLLIPGLGILLIAEVFAMGIKLREEQELTI